LNQGGVRPRFQGGGKDYTEEKERGRSQKNLWEEKWNTIGVGPVHSEEAMTGKVKEKLPESCFKRGVRRDKLKTRGKNERKHV